MNYYNQNYSPINYNPNYDPGYNPNNYRPNSDTGYPPRPAVQLTPAPYQPYSPEQREAALRGAQRRDLWKRSTALGFFILGYFAVMELLVIIAGAIVSAAGIDIASGSTLDYLIQIFASVGSVLIPGAIFLSVSTYRLRDGYKKTFVKPSTLIPLLMIGMAVAMLANYAANMLDSNLSIFGLQNSISFSDEEPLTFSGVWLSIIATAIVPAFAEEFAFRGIVMGSLRKYGDAFAIVASSVMFAAMHANSTQIAFVFPLALLFGLVDVAADSILPSVILHFINNFYAVVLNGLDSNGSLSEGQSISIQLGIIILFLAAGTVSFVYLSKREPGMFRITDKGTTAPDSPASMLSFKEKIRQFFVNPGVMISLSVFASLVIFFLIPGLTE